MDKLPKGIDVHRGSLRLRFYYHGVRCAEVLSGKAPTKTNIAYTANKLAVIKLEIQEGRFDYAHHFPTSKRIQLFSSTQSSRRTIEEGVRDWLAIKKTKVAPSGFRSYTQKAENHVIPKWGHMRFADVTRSDIVRWQNIDLPAQDLTNKTINLIMTPLRGAFEDAHASSTPRTNQILCPWRS